MYRYDGRKGAIAIAALSVVLLLMFSIYSLSFSLLTQQTPKSIPVSGLAPHVSTPEEAANWTLTHIKHAWAVNKAPDSEDNVTLLLEKVKERGYAISYCYGIVLTWSYLLYANNISKPYVLIVQEPDGIYHAIGATLYKDRIYTFYANGKANVTMIQDPFPDMGGFPLPKLINVIGFIPAKYGFGYFSLEDIAVMLRNKTDTVWTGPLVVKAHEYATLKYRNVKQVQGSQPLTVVVRGGDVAVPSKNMYAYEQEIVVKFKYAAVVYAGDWVTILIDD